MNLIERFIGRRAELDNDGAHKVKRLVKIIDENREQINDTFKGLYNHILAFKDGDLGNTPEILQKLRTIADIYNNIYFDIKDKWLCYELLSDSTASVCAWCPFKELRICSGIRWLGPPKGLLRIVRVGELKRLLAELETLNTEDGPLSEKQRKQVLQAYELALDILEALHQARTGEGVFKWAIANTVRFADDMSEDGSLIFKVQRIGWGCNTTLETKMIYEDSVLEDVTDM